MNTQKLTPEQRRRLEQFKAQGVHPAHLERMATRFESYNNLPEVIRGINGEKTDGGKA